MTSHNSREVYSHNATVVSKVWSLFSGGKSTLSLARISSSFIHKTIIPGYRQLPPQLQHTSASRYSEIAIWIWYDKFLYHWSSDDLVRAKRKTRKFVLWRTVISPDYSTSTWTSPDRTCVDDDSQHDIYLFKVWLLCYLVQFYLECAGEIEQAVDSTVDMQKENAKNGKR